MPTEITLQNLEVQDNKLVITPQTVEISTGIDDLPTTPLAEVPTGSSPDTVIVVENGAPRQVALSELKTELGVPTDASEVPYDPDAAALLDATNVQDAIDEVATEVTNIVSDRPVITLTTTSTLGDAVLLSLLNTNNASIPSYKHVDVVIQGPSGQYAYLSVFKTNDNYGFAEGLSYYSTCRFRLNSGTWYLENNTYTVTSQGLTIVCRRIGNVVQFNIASGTAAKTLAAGYVLSYIPEGFRPLMFTELWSTNTQGRITINESGTVTIISSVSEGQAVRVSATYLTGSSVYTG